MSSDGVLLPDARKDVQSVTASWDIVQAAPIADVSIVEILPVPKRDGMLTEFLRPDWLGGLPIGQVFQVVLYPGRANGWHAHAHATDRLFTSVGSIRLVLFDARPSSPTNGVVNEIPIADFRPRLVTVPPGVWHAVQNVGPGSAVILNAPDRAYAYDDPDHWRVPLDSPSIPYTWR